MSKKWTNKKLFSRIIEELKANNLYESIVDYDCSHYDEIEINTIYMDCVGQLTRGGSEGIYVNLFLRGSKLIKLGTIKTLCESRNGWMLMAAMMANFQWYCNEYLRNHMDEFEDIKESE